MAKSAPKTRKRATKTIKTTKTATSRLPATLTLGVAAALDKKAIELVTLDLRGSSAFTDFFVICTGANSRQAQAISDAIEAALKAEGIKPALIEGYPHAAWVLIDCFDVIFHIFTPATREYYGLERLWGDGERIEIPAS
jgi:ribosome-associated protein